MTYNWQQSDWREFKYDFKKLEEYLYQFSHDNRYISFFVSVPNQGLKNL